MRIRFAATLLQASPHSPKSLHSFTSVARNLHITTAREKKRKKMPPKKRNEAEGPGPLLGRFGTSLKCGIVGLPNVG